MSLPIAAAGPSAYWYLARATGAVSLLLLTAVVVLGLAGTLRLSAGSRWPRFLIDGAHRDLSLLTVVVLVIHIVTSVLDGYAPIRLLDAVVPFVSRYRPVWLGLGAMALDIILALVITSLARRRLGLRTWRAVHWLAYLSWPVAVLHGLGTGTDTKVWWMLALTAGCVAAVALVLLARVARAGEGAPRGPAVVLTLASVVGIAVFTLVGPLQQGWARRAGTPASLLGGTRLASGQSPHAAPAATGPAHAPLAPTGPAVPFTAGVSGTVSQRTVAGGAVVDIGVRLQGGASGRLRIRLGGSELTGGGLSMTGSQVDLLLDGAPQVMSGKIVSLEGPNIVAHVSDAAGSSLALHAQLQIDQSNQTVTGQLEGSSA